MKRLHALLLLLATPCVAFAFDPYAYLNYLESIKIATNSVTALQNQMTQIQNQLQMIQMEVDNVKHVSDYRWDNITQLAQQIDQATQSRQSISYAMADIDQRFQEQYPDYAQTQIDYAPEQSESSTLNTVRQSLQALNLNAAHFSEEQRLMENLKTQGETAQGRLQSLQVLSQIAAENVNQLQTLKRAWLSQANAQAAFMAYQVSKDSYETHVLQEIDTQIKTDFPAYQDESKFGLVPYFSQGVHHDEPTQ